MTYNPTPEQREARREANRKFRAAHPGYGAKMYRANLEENRRRSRDNAREWRANNPEKVCKKNKQNREHARKKREQKRAINPLAYKTDASGRQRLIHHKPRRIALWFWQERYEEVKCRDCETVFMRLLQKRGSSFRSDSVRLLCDDCCFAVQSAKAKHIWEEYGDKFRVLASDRMKQRWQADPDGMRELTRINDPERLSAQAKKNWADPEFRERISAARKAMWQDPEYVIKMSEARLRAWRVMAPEVRQRCLDNLRLLWTTKHAKTFREASERLWKDPDYRLKMSLSMQRRWQNDPQHGAKLTAMTLERWQNPEFRKKMSNPEHRDLLKRRADDYYRLATIGEKLAAMAGYEIPIVKGTNEQTNTMRRKSAAARFAKQLIEENLK